MVWTGMPLYLAYLKILLCILLTIHYLLQLLCLLEGTALPQKDLMVAKGSEKVKELCY